MEEAGCAASLTRRARCAAQLVEELHVRLQRAHAAALDLLAADGDDDGDGAGDAVYSKHRAGAMATFPFRAVEAVLMTVPALLPPPTARAPWQLSPSAPSKPSS